MCLSLSVHYTFNSNGSFHATFPECCALSSYCSSDFLQQDLLLISPRTLYVVLHISADYVLSAWWSFWKWRVQWWSSSSGCLFRVPEHCLTGSGLMLSWLSRMSTYDTLEEYNRLEAMAPPKKKQPKKHALFVMKQPLVLSHLILSTMPLPSYQINYPFFFNFYITNLYSGVL